MRSILRGLLLVGLTAAAGECALRSALRGVSDPPHHPRALGALWTEASLRAGRPPWGQATFDPVLGWRPGPGTHQREDRPSWTNDARGERAIPGQGPALPGEIRALIVGDSFTFGVDVADDEAWPARLVAHTEGLHVRNAGVPGYGHGQILLRAHRMLAEEAFDTVLVGWVALDLERTPWRTTFGPKPWFRLDGDRLVHHPIEPTWEEAVRRRQRLPRLFLLAQALYDAARPELRRAREVALGRAILRQLHEEVDAHGARLWVVQLGEYTPVLDEACHTLRCVDATPRLRNRETRDPQYSHFDPEENDRIAQRVAHALVEDGLARPAQNAK